MEIHYSKHHAWYTKKLNAAIEWTQYAEMNIEQILSRWESLPAAIRNNWGWFHNHSLFWESMKEWWSTLSTPFQKKLEEDFGSVEEFKTQFEAAATSRFGSGWAWLVQHNDQLKVISTPNQDSPLMQGMTPLLWLDVREHAYYLHYQNRRADYVNTFWNVVDRAVVEKRMK